MTHEELDDKGFEQMLAEMRRSYNVPPVQAPLAEMWSGIEKEWMGARRNPSALDRFSRGARGLWWLGIAAALVVGVGIGRLTLHASQVTTMDDTSRLASRVPRLADTTAAAYDRTTSRYLGQTAALLIALPGEVRAGRTDPRFVARAAELLMTTRLLLDSPAAADPKVRALLEDVELVLAQVAHLETDRGRVEFELITQALEQRDLLPRLTSAAAGGGEADD
jgi:hypothetical protein